MIGKYPTYKLLNLLNVQKTAFWTPPEQFGGFALDAYSPLMFHIIAPPGYQEMREQSGKSKTELAKEMGTSRQKISNLENGKRELLLSRSDEEKLVEATGTTPELFGGIICKVSSDAFRRSFIMGPWKEFVPTLVIGLAIDLFRRHYQKLSRKKYLLVEALVREARSINADSERQCRLLAEAAIQAINDVRRAKGETIPEHEQL